MKVVNKSRIALDPKQKENLEREIKLLKLLRGCEYVVHLYHVEVQQHLVCDCVWWELKDVLQYISCHYSFACTRVPMVYITLGDMWIQITFRVRKVQYT